MTGVTGQKEEKKEKEKFLHTDGWTGTGTPIKGSTKGPRGPKMREEGKYLEEGYIGKQRRRIRRRNRKIKTEEKKEKNLKEKGEGKIAADGTGGQVKIKGSI